MRTDFKFDFRRGFFSIGNQGGNILLATLILSSAMAGLLLAGQVTLVNVNGQQLNSRQATSRSFLVSMLTRYASMPATLRNSLDNPVLADCVLGSAQGACASGVATPLILREPASSTSDGTFQIIGGLGPIGTAGSAPALFDTFGNRCTTPSDPHCVFQVFSTFTPTCAGGVASCTQAQQFVINFQVISPSYNGSSQLFTTVFSGSPISISDILPSLVTASSGNLAVDALTSVTTITSSSLSKEVLSALGGAGISDPGVLQALSNAKISDPSVAVAVAKALASTVITTQNQYIANSIAQAGIVDPVIANAFMNSSYSSVSDITAIANTIQSAGITDVWTINALAESGIETVGGAQQFVNLMTNSGLVTSSSDQNYWRNLFIAREVQSMNISDPTLISNMVKAISGANVDGSKWWVMDAVLQSQTTTVAGVLALQAQMPNDPSQSATVSTTTTTTSSSTTSGQASTVQASNVVGPPATVSLINTCSGSQCSNSMPY